MDKSVLGVKMNNYRHRIKSMDELGMTIFEVVNKRHPLTFMSWVLYYSDQVFNSHSCPLDGVTNWYCDPKLVTGYPGFYGELCVVYGKPSYSFGSRHFEGTLLHTGGGGLQNTIKYVKESHCVYKWAARIYLADFPLMQDFYEKETVFKILNDDSSEEIIHKFEYGENRPEYRINVTYYE